MNSIRALIVILIFLFNCFPVLSQSNAQAITLTEAFDKIEAQFPIIFSYQDALLDTHIITFSKKTSIKETLDFLRKKTLFDFELVDQTSVTVALKNNVKSACIAIEGYNDPSNNYIVASPFQKITDNKNRDITLLIINNKLPVIITADEYAPISKNISTEESCSPFILQKEITQLTPVTLKNYLVKGISKNDNGSVAIDYEDFDILPGLIEADVLQTIKALPGIQSVNESVSNINIRGGTNDQNLMQWDGIKMYQSGHFFGLISAFNPYATQKVEIIKNGRSASIGDGVSGVIVMEGTNKISDSINSGIALNLLSIDGFTKVPVSKKMSFDLSARKSISNIIETPTYSQYFKKAFQNTEVITSQVENNSSQEDFSFYDTNLRVLYQPSTKDFIRASALVMGNNLSFLESATIDNRLVTRNSNLNQNNLAAGVFYKRQWNEKLNTQIQFSASNYRLEATNQDIINDQQLIQENNLTETNFKIQTTLDITEDVTSSIGYQLNETGITNFERINTPFFQRTEKQVLLTNSGFAEISLKKKPAKFNMTVGLRANHISKFNTVLVEPRFAVKKGFLKYFSAEILGEFKSQTTSQVIDFQNDFLGVENRRWVLSNPNDIPILRSKQLSVGVTYRRKGWLLNVEGYLKNVSGITSQSQGFQNQFKRARTSGDYNVKGIEFLATKSFKSYTSWLSYTYADNTYDFREFTPSIFHNNLDIRHTLTYGINYSFQRFKFSGGINWHSGKPTTLLLEGNEIVNEELNFESPNSSTISDYFRVDVSATYDFSISEKIKGVAGVSIWNLLNTDNNVHHFFVKSEEDGFTEVDEKALQFTPNASLKIFF